MKNFFNLLKVFKETGDLVGKVYSEGWQLPPKITPKTESPKSLIVQEFFDGKNVRFEDISTRKGFFYKAMVSSESNCAEEQFAREVDAGLKELGLETKTSVSKDLTANKVSKYVVTIQVCSC